MTNTPDILPSTPLGFPIDRQRDGVVFLNLDTSDVDKISNLSNPKLPATHKGSVIVGASASGLPGKSIRLDGHAFLEIPHDKSLDCLDGVTLSAWIYPRQFPPGGMRIIDKSPVGAATGYLLDTYPGNSLRLITRDPHLSFKANLPTNRWSHVAATVDGKTGKQALYLNGRPVAESNSNQE